MSELIYSIGAGRALAPAATAVRLPHHHHRTRRLHTGRPGLVTHHILPPEKEAA
jgi:hypothetical protein